MGKDELIGGFVQELRRGTIILCVLAKLKEPQYGYNLIADLENVNIIIEANTLYPMLRRLESQGLLESSWNTESAKPRKYYNTTELGVEILEELSSHWRNTAKNMEDILGGEI